MTVSDRYFIFRSALNIAHYDIDDILTSRSVRGLIEKPVLEWRKTDRIGLTQKQVADVLGCTQANIWLIEKRAIRKIRLRLNLKR